MDISVVGNAKSIFDKQNGKIIDRGDMVIRFNGGVIVNPESQGTKTTVHVFSRYRVPVGTFPNAEIWQTPRLPVGDSGDNPPEFIKERDYLYSVLQARPSNGIIILERLKNDYREHTVRIFGFDWKETVTWYQPDRKPPSDPDPTNTHHYDRERKYCLKLIEQLGWELY